MLFMEILSFDSKSEVGSDSITMHGAIDSLSLCLLGPSIETLPRRDREQRRFISPDVSSTKLISRESHARYTSPLAESVTGDIAVVPGQRISQTVATLRSAAAARPTSAHRTSPSS
jgi:hypothetical protein